jgi:hypothetical protein
MAAASNILGNMTLGINNLVASIQSANPLDNPAVSNRVEQIQVKTVIDSVAGSKTVEDVLTKLNVGTNASKLIEGEIAKLVSSLRSSNAKIADVIGVEGDTLIIKGDFDDVMNMVEKENPDLYNKVIAGLTRVSTGYA